MTSFGWCWCSGDYPQSPDCWSSCNVRCNIRMAGGGGGGGWRVIVVLLWRMYVGMICGTRWEAGADAHWSRYSGWWSGSGGDGGDGNGGGGSGVFF